MSAPLLRRLADNTDPVSWSSQLRRKRFSIFLSLAKADSRRPVLVLDVGGTEEYWAAMGPPDPDLHTTLLNLQPQKCHRPYLTSIVGDARSLHQFRDGEFDIVFSNSVIEHGGSLSDQAAMAHEIRRVGARHFVQTPNFWFPLEPHFLTPFFHWLPGWLRVVLVRRFALGWYGKAQSEEEARRLVHGIRLLTASELRSLFPDSTIVKERVFGLTKSFLVIGPSSRQHPAAGSSAR